VTQIWAMASRSAPRSPLAVLAIALLGIAIAAPMIRLSHDPPLTIAVWRLGFSLFVIFPFLASDRGWRQWSRLSRNDVVVAIVAGVMLALHFWSWNASIFYTSVAASVVLVNTQPIIVALLSAVWLKEMPTSRQWIGITLAVIGACIVGWGDFTRSTDPATAGSHALLGDGLALLGGIAVAIYYVAGRHLRATLDLWPYVALVYGVCFLTLVAIALATSTPLLHQPPRELAIFAGLALGPMLLGHTGLNWALKYLPAYLVVLTVLGEPIGATALAALLPGIREMPSGATFLGGAVLLAGIVVAAMSRRPSHPVETPKPESL
jgi:drug/metabolite transporter (DMT)-like permease